MGDHAREGGHSSDVGEEDYDEAEEEDGDDDIDGSGGDSRSNEDDGRRGIGVRDRNGRSSGSTYRLHNDRDGFNSGDDEDDDDDAYEGNRAGQQRQSARSSSSLPRRMKLPGHPNVVQIVQKPRTHVNHTYRDFSAIPSDGTYSIPGDIDRMTFPEKLFHLLSSTSSYAQESITWRPHGRAFCIKSEDFLQKYGLLKLYFGYARVQRFFKQLLNHDFKQITQGPDKGCFYNEYFLRGMPHLLPYFPEPMERRRLMADPENEPNFSEIACLFYLPGDRRLVVQEARNRLQRLGILIWDTVFETVATTAASSSSSSSAAAQSTSASSSSMASTPAAVSSSMLPPPHLSYPPLLSHAALSGAISPSAAALPWTAAVNPFQGMPVAVASFFSDQQQQRTSATAAGGENDSKPAAKKKPRRRKDR